jgi:hypothetical protein
MIAQRLRSRLCGFRWWLLSAGCFLADGELGAQAQLADENERVIVMEAFKISPGPKENFGLQVQPGRYAARRIVQIIAVVPNTAAAKAGLKPGDTIVTSDGLPVEQVREHDGSGRDVAWRGFYVPPQKRVALAEGGHVSWLLEVQSYPPRGATRKVILALPTEPPHWGAKTWVPPEGRVAATIPESGPLAERAREVLDHGVAVMLRDDLARNLPRRTYFCGYQWSVDEGRTLFVSQARGRTDIILQSGGTYYLTSPAGVLEGAVRNERVPQLDPWKTISLSQARAGFDREVDFWLNKVGKVSSRWPLELMAETASRR